MNSAVASVMVFGYAQAGGVTDGQDDAMFVAIDACEEMRDFLRAQNDRQFLRLPGKRENVFKRPALFERNPVEEAERPDGEVN